MANLEAKRFNDVCSYSERTQPNKSNFINIGRKEKILHPAEAEWICKNKNYLMTCTAIYEAQQDARGDYFMKKIYCQAKAQFCKRGRFFVGDADFIYQITGVKL